MHKDEEFFTNLGHQWQTLVECLVFLSHAPRLLVKKDLDRRTKYLQVRFRCEKNHMKQEANINLQQLVKK